MTRHDQAQSASVVRTAEASEIDAIARVWFNAWGDAHAAIVPAEITRARTLESFRTRVAAGLPAVRVVGPVGGPLGMCMIKDAELDQLFVSAAARGTGIAAALLADGEARIAASGFDTAWLACAIGNHRAARFYEKHGWTREGIVARRLTTAAGEFVIDVWHYEKALVSRP